MRNEISSGVGTRATDVCNFIFECERRAIANEHLDTSDLKKLIEAPLPDLASAANRIRAARCGTGFDLCSIVNAKSGRCPENCRFCAQSVHHQTIVDEYPLIDETTAIEHAARNTTAGATRFSLVASGQKLTHSEVDHVARLVSRIKEETGASVCASLGLLSRDQFTRLAEAGLERVHNNLETSRSFFPRICTTHTYDEKIDAIRNAQAAGLDVCSGGIIGLGETWQDRIEMALELRTLGVSSVPINVLNPIAGTPLGNMAPLHDDEVIRTVALFRFALPDVAIRLAGGRALLAEAGRYCFSAGANAAISGDMLTTAGFAIASDRAMAEAEGFVIKPDTLLNTGNATRRPL